MGLQSKHWSLGCKSKAHNAVMQTWSSYFSSYCIRKSPSCFCLTIPWNISFCNNIALSQEWQWQHVFVHNLAAEVWLLPPVKAVRSLPLVEAAVSLPLVEAAICHFHLWRLQCHFHLWRLQCHFHLWRLQCHFHLWRQECCQLHYHYTSS